MRPLRNCSLITVEGLEGLLGRGDVGAEELVRALNRQCESGCPLGETLVGMGLITRSQLSEAMAEYLLSERPYHPRLGQTAQEGAADGATE